jgi:hypothetical protein
MSAGRCNVIRRRSTLRVTFGRDSQVAGVSRNTRGSTDSLSNDFQPFGINDLKLVDQSSGSWNQVHEWLSQLEALRCAA